jgi:hypothetical protein
VSITYGPAKRIFLVGSMLGCIAPHVGRYLTNIFIKWMLGMKVCYRPNI